MAIEREGRKQEVEKRNGIISVKSFGRRLLPIREVFSPTDEVRKILSAPTSQRKEALTTFTTRLANQQEAWALCRTFVARKIQSDPDVSKEEMLGAISQFSSSYGFSKEQIDIAKQLVENYLLARKRMLKVRREYPDDIILVNHLTGLKFTEKDRSSFRITTGPISVDVKTNKLNAGKIYSNATQNEALPLPLAFYDESIGRRPVSYVIFNGDPSSATINHEHQHAENSLRNPKWDYDKQKGTFTSFMSEFGNLRYLYMFFFSRKTLAERFTQRYMSERTIVKRKLLLENFFSYMMGKALDRAKNEIFAYHHDINELSAQNITRLISTVLCSPESVLFEAYDYLRYIRNKKKDKLWQEYSQKILVDEYAKTIKSATEAITKLRLDGGYSTEKAIAFLSDKTLADWPKAVRRQLEVRGNRGLKLKSKQSQEKWKKAKNKSHK